MNESLLFNQYTNINTGIYEHCISNGSFFLSIYLSLDSIKFNTSFYNIILLLYP